MGRFTSNALDPGRVLVLDIEWIGIDDAQTNESAFIDPINRRRWCRVPFARCAEKDEIPRRSPNQDRSRSRAKMTSSSSRIESAYPESHPTMSLIILIYDRNTSQRQHTHRES